MDIGKWRISRYCSSVMRKPYFITLLLQSYIKTRYLDPNPSASLSELTVNNKKIPVIN